MASSTYEEVREYDIIFAGGGTAACVAAGRLANADPSLSILIVERGRNNLNDPTVTTPALFGSHFDPKSKSNIFYQAESEPALGGRERVVMTGGILGGGSSTNAMMYTRAQGVDYDSFKTEGWDSESLLKYAKKVSGTNFYDYSKC
jgi:alcohol oxidase